MASKTLILFGLFAVLFVVSEMAAATARQSGTVKSESEETVKPDGYYGGGHGGYNGGGGHGGYNGGGGHGGYSGGGGHGGYGGGGGHGGYGGGGGHGGMVKSENEETVKPDGYGHGGHGHGGHGHGGHNGGGGHGANGEGGN